MNKNTWIATAAFGLVIAAPTAAYAHGTYLEAVDEAVQAEYNAVACPLPGMTCGLCHQPNSGDPELDITIGFKGIEVTIRDRAFYEALGTAGWNHSDHMPGMGHIDDNRGILADTALPAMIADTIDSDGDGVSDLEELSLGYNPIVAYDEAEPDATALCDQAEPFPDVGMGSSSGGEGSSSGGEGSSSGGEAGETTTGPGGSSSEGGTVDPTNPTDPTDPTATGTGTGSGSSGGETGAGDDGGGGCRIASSGYDTRILGMLLMLGLVARRRRRQ